jgi:hypothetical protein
MPQHLVEVLAALSRVSYLERSAYQHCLRDDHKSLVAKLAENKAAFDNGVPRIFAIVMEALQRNHQQQRLLGDPKLHQLQKQFVEYAEKVTVAATPVVSAPSADVDALRAVIVEQSKQIEALTTAQAENTKQLNAKIDGLTAMIERLLAQQTVQSAPSSQSAASGPRLFGVASS